MPSGDLNLAVIAPTSLLALVPNGLHRVSTDRYKPLPSIRSDVTSDR
jgi:hypothetical protein